jgi:hypothetical protein
MTMKAKHRPSVTALEMEILAAIRDSEYHDGTPESYLAPVWSFSVTENEHSRAGALGSLKKKALVECWQDDGEQTRLTELGLEILENDDAREEVQRCPHCAGYYENPSQHEPECRRRRENVEKFYAGDDLR